MQGQGQTELPMDIISHNFSGLVQDCSISSVLVMEI